MPRARPPVRGGGVALHAHRRQHARHLRVREGAPARRAARRDARGEPRARHLRPRVRPHRRHRRRRARTSSARSSSRAGRTSAETIRALLALGNHLEISDADYDAAGAPTPRRSIWRSGSATCPAQVELHAALATARRLPRRLGRGRELHRGSAELAEREGLVGKLCLPVRARAACSRWRERRLGRGRAVVPARRTSSPTRSAGPRSPARSLFGARAAPARPRRLQRRRDRARPARSTSASAPGSIAQSIQAIARARARASPRRAHGRRRSEAAEEAERLAERLHYPVGDAASLEARGALAADPAEGADMLRQARELWPKLGRPLNAARCDLWIGRRLRETEPQKAQAAVAAAASEFERCGVPHLAERARELSAQPHLGLAPRGPPPRPT